MDGALIAGDAGGFMNSMRSKGIHLAMRTGMLAAESRFRGGARQTTRPRPARRVPGRHRCQRVERELYPVRNVHQAFGHGLVSGVMFSGSSLVTGVVVQDPMPSHAGSRADARRSRLHTMAISPSPITRSKPVKIDRQLTFDRVTERALLGHAHREDEPSHLIVHDTTSAGRVRVEVSAIRARASVPPTSTRWWTTAQAARRLQINASNCVHCKTCDIMDPYQIIDWVPPEGGEGPQYEGM
jgi:electron-transferring-flavoprotein dehydrogenase